MRLWLIFIAITMSLWVIDARPQMGPLDGYADGIKRLACRFRDDGKELVKDVPFAVADKDPFHSICD